jgi:putative FmdB family regulatory protein
VPTYQYVCTECGGQLETVQKFTDEPLTVHETCGGRLRKVFSPVGIVFKGSGFYRTDSRDKSSSSSSDSSQTDSSKTDSSKTDSSKSDSSASKSDSSSDPSKSSGSSESSPAKAAPSSSSGEKVA